METAENYERVTLRFVMWIITDFGQFVLFRVEFDMCKRLIDFIV